MSFAPLVSALLAELEVVAPRAERLGLSQSEAWNALVVAVLRDVLEQVVRARGADVTLLQGGRLFASAPGFEAGQSAARDALAAEITLPPLPPLAKPWPELPLETFGQLYESLLAARPSDARHSLRKRTGSYYTPEVLTRMVVERALDALEAVLGPGGLAARRLRILDPALGAGAFLMQVGRETARRSGRPLAEVVEHELFGADVSPLAVAVAEASLWLLAGNDDSSLAAAGTRLREGDALCAPAVAQACGRDGVDFVELAGGRGGFDLVLGNPPWVAFAGRATQPLAPLLREHYRRTFKGFRGYPTLHALFVELGAKLASQGVVALLVPSPLSDLEGYRPLRSALSVSHAVCEPLLELGQDAFESVTQPCFVLVAVPRREPAQDPGRAFVLSERSHAAVTAGLLRIPRALEQLANAARLPAELFGEMGLQTSSAVTRQLLYRGSAPPPEFDYPLLEGRNVVEFAQRSVRLFLKQDRQLLRESRCKVREPEEYSRVKLVVRQTAAITIAALHAGTPFRNSLLAGFELPEFPAELVLGLLNSTLYRALHLAGRRDARQGAFPQVKIAHLRALPAPPRRSSACQLIASLSRTASEHGLTVELRDALDRAVFSEFGISSEAALEIATFVKARAPSAGLVVPL